MDSVVEWIDVMTRWLSDTTREAIRWLLGWRVIGRTRWQFSQESMPVDAWMYPIYGNVVWRNIWTCRLAPGPAQVVFDPPPLHPNCRCIDFPIGIGLDPQGRHFCWFPGGAQSKFPFQAMHDSRKALTDWPRKNLGRYNRARED